MKLQNRARNIATGEVIKTGTVTIKGPDGNALGAAISVDATTGLWSYTGNGQPGYTTQTFEYASQKKIVEGDTWGQNGFWYEGELTETIRILGDGVAKGIDGELAVTAGTGLTVQVATGMALVRGVLFPIYNTGDASSRVTLAAAPTATGQLRKDRIVIRLERVTTVSPQRYAGRCYLAALTGTPAASPTVPAVTQDSNVWEIPLATVTVGTNATSLSAGVIDQTDRVVTGNFSVVGHTHTSSAITDFSEAAQDAVGTILVDSTSVDFTYTDATPSITAAVKYAGTGAAATAARSDHTHSLSGKVTLKTNDSPPSIGAGGAGQDSAPCGTGEVVIGGGCRAIGTVNMVVRESYPGPGQSWVCSVKNEDTKSMTLQVYVMCLNTTV